MKFLKLLSITTVAIAALLPTSCKDKKSYADLLTDETKAINNFLADQIVVLDVPEDGKLEYGPEAPYYRIDPDGNVFMQIIDPGEDAKVPDDAQVFFRFTRYNLYYYQETGELTDGQGNAGDVTSGNSSFRFNNYTLSSSSQWGSGLQQPLNYVGYNSRVNLIVKSQYGLQAEISQVIPYLYDIRYFRAVSE